MEEEELCKGEKIVNGKDCEEEQERKNTRKRERVEHGRKSTEKKEKQISKAEESKGGA